MFSRSGSAPTRRFPLGLLALKQCRPLLTSTTWLTRQSQDAIISFSACSLPILRCSIKKFVVSLLRMSSALLRSRSMPTVIHAFRVSMRGHSSFMLLSTSTVTLISL